jgi:hypothetical protein
MFVPAVGAAPIAILTARLHEFTYNLLGNAKNETPLLEGCIWLSKAPRFI